MAVVRTNDLPGITRPLASDDIRDAGRDGYDLRILFNTGQPGE